MIIGIPKEIKNAGASRRPASLRRLPARGSRATRSSSSAARGTDAGYPDDDYAAAGAKLVDSHDEAFRADLIIKVKEPLPSEYALLQKGRILFTYLHLAADLQLTQALLKSGVTAIAYETVTRNRHLPLLEPMSEIAGRMSVIVGGHFLAKPHGGKGVLLGGVPGVLPGKVVVLGGGTSGVNAARMATGLGADVTILEVDVERMRFLDITMNTAHTLYSSEAHLTELLPTVDLLIGAVARAGERKRPKLNLEKNAATNENPAVSSSTSPSTRAAARKPRAPTTHDDPVFSRGRHPPLLRDQHARRLRPAPRRRRSPMSPTPTSKRWRNMASTKRAAAKSG